MDGIHFSEQEFYQQQFQRDRRWGFAVNFAIVLHVAVFAGALYLPNLFERKPLLDEVMTIDLVSLPETAEVVKEPPPPAVTQQQASPKPEPVQQQPEPEPVAAVEVPPVEPTAPPEPVVEAKPISITPLKRKIKKAEDTRLAEEKQREQKAAELKRQEKERQRELARAREEERKARQQALARAREEEKRAQQAAQQARAELAAVIKARESFRSPSASSGGRSGNKQVDSAAELQYYADLRGRVQRLWVLPEIKKWPPTLETDVEFTVLRDGRLVGLKVVKSSGDTFFDRFARETVLKAAPMQPIPPVLRKDKMDIGFRFRPGGIQ